MARDAYLDFEDLAKHEKADRDYQIFVRDVRADVTIVAPHGGRIEPGTSEIARKIAAEEYNCYCFEGLKAGNNASLHITSHKFDEPDALKLVSSSAIVIAVHACTGISGSVFLGGRNTALISSIAAELDARGIRVSLDDPRFKGSNPDNICNRGETGKGVQLEVTRD